MARSELDPNTVGRPSKYLDKTPEQWEKLCDDYLASCVDKIEPIVGKDGSVLKYEIWANFPTIQGLCLVLDIHDETLNEWGRKYDHFSDTLRRLKQKQADRLMKMGAGGHYTTGVVTRILAANHGMVEPKEKREESSGNTVIQILGGASVTKQEGVS